jgi:uncharacterized RDD family membrane protein YckC
MKCPKCGYLGFEPVERCRNCGYDFSLTAAAVEFPEFPIREDARTLNPLDDLALIDAATAGELPAATTDSAADLDRDLHPPAPPRTTSPSSELPLFRQSIPDDQPLITKASPPRAPLAVRRATPEVPRVRAEQPRPQSLDLQSFDLTSDSLDQLDIDDDVPVSRIGSASVTPAARAGASPWPAERPERPEPAEVGTRLVAVIIDLVLLGIVDAIVLYFTMEICGISWQELGILPKGPLLAFLLVQNGGYLVAFTVGGQTLGKMATGIRVVATESAGTLDLGRAITRTIVWLMLAVPAGLGFLTLFSRDHRGLHDRFAGTRVVRASV